MKKLLLATIISGGLFATTATLADSHNKNRHFGKKPNPMKMYKKLDLSEEQADKIKAIFKKNRQANKDARKAKREQRKIFIQKQREMIEATSLDQAGLEQLASEHANQKKAQFINMVTTQHKAWQVLTPAQKTKAKDMMAKRADKMKKRAEKRKKKQDK